MSTPIAYITININYSLMSYSAIHTSGQGILDGWLDIMGYHGDATPYFNNTNILPWHFNAFNAIYNYGTTYDHSWIFGVYTPLFLYIYAEYHMIMIDDGASDVDWDSRVGSHPHEIGDSTPSLEQFDMNNNWYATNIISDGRGVFGFTGQTGNYGVRYS